MYFVVLVLIASYQSGNVHLLLRGKVMLGFMIYLNVIIPLDSS